MPGGEGHLNNSVAHMRDQRMQKKGCFMELNARIAIGGQNVPIFKKKSDLESFFKLPYSTKYVPKKSC